MGAREKKPVRWESLRFGGSKASIDGLLCEGLTGRGSVQSLGSMKARNGTKHNRSGWQDGDDRDG